MAMKSPELQHARLSRFQPQQWDLGVFPSSEMQTFSNYSFSHQRGAWMGLACQDSEMVLNFLLGAPVSKQLPLPGRRIPLLRSLCRPQAPHTISSALQPQYPVCPCTQLGPRRYPEHFARSIWWEHSALTWPFCPGCEMCSCVEHLFSNRGAVCSEIVESSVMKICLQEVGHRK